MNVSLNFHVENGQIVLDQPIKLNNNTKGVLTILNNLSNNSSQRQDIHVVLNNLRKANPFQDIDDVSIWQNKVRKERTFL